MNSDVMGSEDPTIRSTRSRTNLRIAALMLGTFTVGLAEYVLIGQLDLVAVGLDTSEAAAGQLVTVFALAYAVATPVLVAALARRSRRAILTTGFAIFAAMNLFSFFAPDYTSFTAARVIMAVAAGLIVVTSIASVSRVVPPSMTGRGIATVQMGFTASLILGVPIGRLIAEAAGWRSVFILLAILAAISAILVRLALPPLEGRAGVRLRDQLGLLRDTRVLTGLSITLLWLGGYSIAYTYLTPYLSGPVAASSLAVTLILFVFGLASLVGTHLGGRHADKRGHFHALATGKTIHVIILIAIPLMSGSVWITAAAIVVWSLSAWSSAAPQQMRISDIEPSSADTLIGLNQSTMQLGIAAGAGIGGALIPAVGLHALPWVAAFPVLASLLLLWLAHKKRRANNPTLTPATQA